MELLVYQWSQYRVKIKAPFFFFLSNRNIWRRHVQFQIQMF